MKVNIDSELLLSVLQKIEAGEMIQRNSVIAIDLHRSLMKAEEIDSLLKCFVNLIMIDYVLGSIPGDSDNKITADFSDPEHLLMKKLYKQGVTLKTIEETIISNDWTGCLGYIGSGDRERGLVMKRIEDIYHTI